MAEKILTQDEVDALLSGVSKGAIDTGISEVGDDSGIKNYDLTSQDKVVRGRMPAMEIINEKFARLMRGSISSLIKKVVLVSVDDLSTVKLGEFIRNTPLPASFNIFSMKPFRGLGTIVFDASLVFLTIDYLFGGGGKYHVRVEGREFTRLENRVIHKLAEKAFEDMATSWRSVHEMEFIFNRSEINPHFINIGVPTEVVIATRFKVEIGSRSGTISICIPYSSVEPIKEKLYASYQSDSMDVDRTWVERFTHETKESSVSCACVLGRAKVNVNDFLDLNVGDIIQLDTKAKLPVMLDIEGIPKFSAKLGLFEGSYACQVVDYIGEGGE